MSARRLMRVGGSSPRVRGTRTELRGGVEAAPVHPRVCGERAPLPRGIHPATGSSPRVRGTPHPGVRRRPVERFIPACAGNAHRYRGASIRPPVHPRVCGERNPAASVTARANGSSPRVRGTPAASATGRARPSVHPRVCGERNDAIVANDEASGSSPRVRGTLRPLRTVFRQRRFIPACAGNACPGRGGTRPPSVHPRVCGERYQNRGPRPRRQRFIPACAGNADTTRRLTPTAPVHPRVCGERPPAHPPVHRLGRFIPACAGNATGRRRRTPRSTVHPRVCGERNVQP